MEEPNNFIFVYGSLLDERNKYAADLKNSCRFYQKGRFKGKLYDIGNYPGAVSNPECDGFVHGSIFILNKAAETLKILDDYEGFGWEHPQPNEFIRELINIETDAGMVRCWVYLYNWPIENFSQILGGSYFAY